ncbi:hypothetical protein OS493_031347 [Desmophyllum pertusum]|uniref:Uncharacterized protein n=1 Tax=Desmophyllum pertusum TaxID=174260 RepID=A0A9W9YWE2_9CNID|nr:hypothetical protein OS493_031347 [Desmophyllum pertusum]
MCSLSGFRCLLGVISLVSLVYQRNLLQNSSTYNFLFSTSALIENKTFLLNEDEGNSIVACKLPTLDPFHPSVLQFIKDLGKLHCEGVSYSSFDKNVLRVEGEGIVSAQYRKIERTPGNDFGIVLSDPVSVQRVTAGTQKGHFIGNTSVDADFIRVEVVTSSGETKSDVHMHVFPKKEVLVRALTPDGIPLDVALIMFDSTSAANFKRKMPNSLKYLTNNLDSILLQGETIVGDGTTAQLAALLTGIEEKRQPEARRRKDSSQPVDSWRYKDRPKFAFSSHADISHNAVNPVGYADDDLKATLQTMEKESFLNNTLLIIFGDHGPRFSAFRKTIQGKLEERFPFMSITTPKWFPGKYPDLYNNLVHNSRVLTSPFDVYATLRHILSYPQYPSGIVTGQSLFSRIDEKNRTCASAGVEDHWCPCLDLEEVSSNEPVVNEAAEFVVGYINNLTSQSDEMTKLCLRLVLKEIKSAFREMPKEAMQRFSGTKNDALDACDGCEAVMGDKADNTLVRDTLYQLQIVTSPNEGFYEASIRMKKGVPSLVGDISRIDAYKDQPYCIMEKLPLLRKYCFCPPKTFVKEQ